MKIDIQNSKVYIRPGATDLRKGSLGLSMIINNQMKKNVLDGSLYLFCNKNRKLLKIIYWDKSGYWLAQKRLEESTWPWPSTEEEVREITQHQLEMLLEGIDFFRAHKELHYKIPF